MIYFGFKQELLSLMIPNKNYVKNFTSKINV